MVHVRSRPRMSSSAASRIATTTWARPRPQSCKTPQTNRQVQTRGVQESPDKRIHIYIHTFIRIYIHSIYIYMHTCIYILTYLPTYIHGFFFCSPERGVVGAFGFSTSGMLMVRPSSQRFRGVIRDPETQSSGPWTLAHSRVNV